MADEKYIILSLDSDLIKKIPTDLRESTELQEITGAEDKQFERIAMWTRRWLDNVFPDTTNEEGIRRWEEFLELTPEPGDSPEDRKVRVIAKLNETLPYTWISLHKMLANIVGWDNFKLERDGARITFSLTVKQPSDVLINSILDTFSRVIPLNLYWIFSHKPETESKDLKVLSASDITTSVEVQAVDDHNYRRWAPFNIYAGGQNRIKIIINGS